MASITKLDIVNGLRELGIREGDKILVHSSIVAIGKVDGGADAVIDALLESVGENGLVVMPTFACKSPFNYKTSATPLGVIADNFWRRPGALRSKHPTHSVAAIGKGADELIKNHEKAPTAYAEGTPYYSLAINGGKILLLGVDQDRNTTLHTTEALANSPYLKKIEAVYIDDDGSEVKISVDAMAGPHRDFIGLDKLFREKGIMTTGKIGNAVCRLIDGKSMIEVAVDALKKDPAAVLCDNPECADCIMQRGLIKKERLSNENFRLAAVAGDISDNIDEILAALQGEGITAVEVTEDEYSRFSQKFTENGIEIVAIRGNLDCKKSQKIANELNVPLIMYAGTFEEIESAADIDCLVLIENNGAVSAVYSKAYETIESAPALAFNPGAFAREGEKPFLEVFYKGTLRKHTAHFYIDDATFDGRIALPGMGNGEVKEIISMLRCRSYGGIMTLRSHNKGIYGFREAASAFWKLIDNM